MLGFSPLNKFALGAISANAPPAALAANAFETALASGALSTAIKLTAAALQINTASANLSTTGAAAALQANAAGQVTGTASPTTAINMQGNAADVVVANGQLLAQIK